MDCADRDRIDEAKQELHRIVNDREMKDAIILIFANKQDLPDGMLVMIVHLHMPFLDDFLYTVSCQQHSLKRATIIYCRVC